MVKIDCNKCENSCCKNKLLNPYLLPSEEKLFKKFSEKAETTKKVLLLKRNKDGNCIFLDEKDKCKIYKKRPFDCRLYPILLNFKDKKPYIWVDRKFCPNSGEIILNERKILKTIKSLNLPENWVKDFEKWGAY